MKICYHTASISEIFAVLMFADITFLQEHERVTVLEYDRITGDIFTQWTGPNGQPVTTPEPNPRQDHPHYNGTAPSRNSVTTEIQAPSGMTVAQRLNLS